MRYSTGHKEATKARLIEMSGAIVKKNGFATTGVDSLMETVGLTGGAFYSHFPSKSRLLQAIIEHELTISRKLLANKKELPLDEWVLKILNRYLCIEHVEHPETGCPLPTLSMEVARSEKSVKHTYETTLTNIKNCLAERIGHEAAWAMIAQCVGAIVIARAMGSEESGKKVLGSSKRFLKKALLKKGN